MRRLLEKDVLLAWGKRKVQEITRRDVVVLLDKVRDRGAPVTANRLLGRLTRLFNFACERGILEESPCTRLKKTEEQPRERVLTDAELAAFWQGIDDTGIHPGTALALRLILVTGQRPGEVSGMAWGEIDEHWWTIPAERTKNGREHRVPLTTMAHTLLTHAKELSGENAYVFPSPRPQGNSKPLEVRSLSRAIDRKHVQLGIDKFVPHDLRRGVESHAAGYRSRLQPP
jgi:integrase